MVRKKKKEEKISKQKRRENKCGIKVRWRVKKYEVAIPYTEPTPVRKGGKRKHCVKEKRKLKVTIF